MPSNPPGATGSVLSRLLAWWREWGSAVFLLVFAVLTVALLLHLYEESTALYQTMARQGAHFQTKTVEQVREIYTSEVVARVQPRGVLVTHDYADHEGAIPLPATLTMVIGDRLAQGRPGAHLRLFSNHPFPWREKTRPPLDLFQTDALTALEQRPDVPFFRFEEYDGRPSLRYAVADRMTSACLSCHNDLKSGSPKNDWREGDVRGVLEVIRPLDNAVALAHAKLQRTLSATVAAYGFGLVGLSAVALRLKRTSRKLSESETRIRKDKAFIDSIIEHLPIMLFIKDADGLRLEHLNRAGEELLGRNRRELIGKSDFDCFPPAQAAAFVAQDQEVLSGKKLVDIPEEAIETARGRRTLHTRKIPILDEQGKPTHLLGISEDITQRKQAEEALRRAMEAAQAANKAKSEFLANMSHEIRTPMNPIVVLTGQLLQENLTAEQREALETVQLSADILVTMIDDILHLSAIESGKVELQTIAFDFRDHVSQTLKALEPQARKKGLDFAIQMDGVPDRVVGDPGRLRQVFRHLVGNAIKFTEKGEVRVRVLASAKTQDEVELHFTVRDTGIGIPAEKLSLLFKAFSQTDASSTRNYGGTGLGLAISQSLAALMKGRTWAESEPGKGSVFHFTALLGLSRETASPPRPPSKPDAILPNSTPQGKSLNVLLAEDDNLNQKLVIRLLQKRGHRVVAVENGKLAFEVSSKERFDVLLMDLMMPELDGLAATAAIRARERATGEHLPILAVTARVGDEDREECRKAGMDGHLSKPIRAQELYDALDRLAAQATGS